MSRKFPAAGQRFTLFMLLCLVVMLLFNLWMGYQQDREDQRVRQGYIDATNRAYLQAAEQGDANAQVSLGVRYLRGPGQGRPQDYIEAYKWLDLGARKLPGVQREEVVMERNLAERRMTPAELMRAQQMVRDWKPIRPEGEPSMPNPAGPEGRTR